MDTLTGKKRKATTISGLPPDVSQISLRTWLSADEVTALTTSVRCRPRSEVPDDEPAVVDPPFQAIHVTTEIACRLCRGTETSGISCEQT